MFQRHIKRNFAATGETFFPAPPVAVGKPVIAKVADVTSRAYAYLGVRAYGLPFCSREITQP